MLLVELTKQHDSSGGQHQRHHHIHQPIQTKRQGHAGSCNSDTTTQEAARSKHSSSSRLWVCQRTTCFTVTEIALLSACLTKSPQPACNNLRAHQQCRLLRRCSRCMHLLASILLTSYCASQYRLMPLLLLPLPHDFQSSQSSQALCCSYCCVASWANCTRVMSALSRPAAALLMLLLLLLPPAAVYMRAGLGPCSVLEPGWHYQPDGTTLLVPGWSSTLQAVWAAGCECSHTCVANDQGG